MNIVSTVALSQIESIIREDRRGKNKMSVRKRGKQRSELNKNKRMLAVTLTSYNKTTNKLYTLVFMPPALHSLINFHNHNGNANHL